MTTSPALDTAAPLAAQKTPLTRLKNFGRPPRLMGLDVARALAVLGMFAAHLAEPADSVVLTDPSTWSGLSHGLPALLFALLAGFSLTLMTYKDGAVPAKEKMPQVRLNILGRGVAIFLVGLLLEQLGTAVAVILTLYGVLYVLALPLIRAKTWVLYTISVVLALLGPALLAVVQALSLSAAGSGLSFVFQPVYSLPAWMSLIALGMALGRLNLRKWLTAVVFIAVGLVTAFAGFGISYLVTGSSPITLSAQGVAEYEKDSVSGGMVNPTSVNESLGNTNALTGAEEVPGSEVDLSDKVCAVYKEDGTVMCYPSGDMTFEGGSKSGSESDAPGITSAWDTYGESVLGAGLLENPLMMFLDSSPHSGGTMEIIGSAGVAMLTIGVCLLACRVLRWVLVPVAALGAMPLTAYAAHVVVFWIAAGPMGSVSSNAFWSWLSVGLLVFSTVWLMFFERGPLEAFPRWLGRRFNNK